MTLEEPDTLTKPSPTSSPMSTKTPEQQAEERWPDNIVNEYGSTSSDGQLGARIGCATAIRELVEPRDRLLQELVDALADPHKMSLGTAAIAKAKERFGITPTNQK